MQISTDSDQWKGASNLDIKQKKEDFLNDHPDQAYSSRAISDEIFETELTGEHRFGIDPEEHKNAQTILGTAIGTGLAQTTLLSFTRDRLHDLYKEGTVEVREVNVQDISDNPNDVETKMF